MTRRLYTLASALSLVLCITAGVLWARSHWAEDEVFLRRYTGPLSASNSTAAPMYHYQSFGVCWTRDMLAFFRITEVPSTFDPSESLSDRQRNPRGVRVTVVHKPANNRLAGVLSDPERTYLRFVHVLSVRNPVIGRRVFVGVPFWGAVALLSVLPITWLALRIYAQNIRARAGFCRSCGYDLRGTPDRCPECGQEAAAEATI